MKKLFTFIVGAFVGLGAYSQSFDSGGLYYEVLSPDDQTCAVTGHNSLSYGTVLEIPGRVEYDGMEYSVEAIANDAFWNCNELSKVIIPNSIKEIGNSSFAYSFELRTLELGSSLEIIHSGAFVGCPLNVVVANGESPAECEYGYSNVFTSNPLVAVSEGIVSEYQSAWAGANVVPNIPASSIDFEQREYNVAPGGSIQLNCVIDPANAPFKYINNYSDVISIDNNGMLTVDPLKGGFNLPVQAETLNGLTAECWVYIEPLLEFSIDGFTYVATPNTDNEVALIRYESNATVVEIPETVVYDGNVYTVTTIDREVFVWNGSIEEVTIPATVNLIREYNFNSCSSLKKVTIADSRNTLQLSNDNITSNNSLTDIYVGRNLTTSGDYVFRGNDSFTSLVLGELVTELPSYIFRESYRLNLVQSKNPVPPVLGEDVFNWSVPKIIVPEGSVDAYKEAWMQYADYISEAVEATDLSVASEEMTLYNGQCVKLEYTVEPEDASVSFSSSNPNLVSVDTEGYIQYDWWRDQTGEAIITVSTLNGLSAECKVTAQHWLAFPELVNEDYVNELSLAKGTSEQVVIVKAEALADQTVTWRSNNGDVATVDENGLITAEAFGNAEVYASVEVPELGTYEARIDVNVYAEPTGITPEQTEISVVEGGETQVSVTVEPADDENINREMTWTVSPEIAEVEQYYWGINVRGLQPGKATITGTTINGISVDYDLTVKAQIERIEFASDPMYLGVGQSKQIEFTTVPEVTYQTFSYRTNNEDVATVDPDGVVTAHNLGSTEIGIEYATPWGYNEIRWMTVEVVVMPESVSFVDDKSDFEGQIGNWIYINDYLRFTPEDEDVCKHIDWTIDNPEVVEFYDWANAFVGRNFGSTAIHGVTVNGLQLEGTITIAGIQLTVDGEPVNYKEVGLHDSFQVGVNASPEKLLDHLTLWSDNQDVITVAEDRTVTAVGYGRAWVNAQTWIEVNVNDENDEKERKYYYASFEVTVAPEEGIALSKKDLTLTSNNRYYITLASAPGVEVGEVTWESSDNSVAEIGNIWYKEAEIRYVGPGTATITATDQNGNTAECFVSCLGLELKLNGETVDEWTTYNLEPGMQMTLEVNAYPAELMDHFGMWSDDPKIASVDQDRRTVTAEGYGSTDIYASSIIDYNGEEMYFSQRMRIAVSPSEGIVLNETEVVLNQGDWFYLSVYGAEGLDLGQIDWDYDSNVVEMVESWDNWAQFRYLAPGQTTITAYDPNSGYTTETGCVVTCLGLQLEVNGVTTDSYNAVRGELFRIDVKAYPESAYANTTFGTNNPSVATVDEYGNVTAVAYGTAWINVNYSTEFEGEPMNFYKELQVNVAPSYGIALDKEQIAMTGGWDYLTLAAAPGVEVGEVTWTSSNENAAIIVWANNDQAEIQYVGPGVTDVYATDQNGNVAVCTVTCCGLLLSVNGVTTDSYNAVPGEQFRINVEAYPAELGDNVGYGSDNGSVASVDGSGLVTAEANGTATIYVTSWYYNENNEERYFQSLLQVKVAPASGIELSTEKVVLTPNEGQNTSYISLVCGHDVDPANISWSSSDESVANISWSNTYGAEIAFVGPGYATITATDGNYEVSCNVTCYQLELNPTDLLINTNTNTSFQFEAKVLPEGTDAQINWMALDPDMATIDENGLLTAKDVTGYTVVLAYAWIDGKYYLASSCSIEITDYVAVTSITLDESIVGCSPGDIIQLIATVNPANATNKEVEWTSTDTSVATVNDDGLVRVVGKGYTEIIATSADNNEISANCQLYSNYYSGVDEILQEGEPFDIYDMNGILIRKDATADDYNQLQQGIYLLRSGDKVYKVQK